jgi:hypothetical protein
MTEQATVSAHSIDSIVEDLDRFHQRATYGAVAALLNRAPRNLMQGRSRSVRDSWIVSGGTGLPTGYEPGQMHPEIHSRETILRSATDLSAWLGDPS